MLGINPYLALMMIIIKNTYLEIAAAWMYGFPKAALFTRQLIDLSWKSLLKEGCWEWVLRWAWESMRKSSKKKKTFQT